METLAIVVPAYNEERRLPALLAALAADGDRVAASAGLRLDEVVVVDDGSDDATASLLTSSAKLAPRLRPLRLERHRGKGAAVRAGMGVVTSRRALVTDVDLSTPLTELGILSAALDGAFDIAMGSRALPGSRVRVHQPRHRELLGKSFNLALRLTTGIPYRDTQCGFKLFDVESTRTLFQLQRVDGFAYDAELCVNARRLGLRVAEVPVEWVNSPDTRVTLVRSSARMALDLARVARLARRRPRRASGAG